MPEQEETPDFTMSAGPGVDTIESSAPPADDECDGDVYTLYMSDTYGDGWNGNLFTINGESYTVDTGYGDQADVCLADGCYDVTVDGGSW